MNNLSSVEVILLAALEKGSPLERGTYLDEACAGDADLRRRVEKMLAAQSQAGSFLERPAAEFPAPAAAEETPVAGHDQPHVRTHHSWRRLPDWRSRRDIQRSSRVDCRAGRPGRAHFHYAGADVQQHLVVNRRDERRRQTRGIAIGAADQDIGTAHRRHRGGSIHCTGDRGHVAWSGRRNALEPPADRLRLRSTDVGLIDRSRARPCARRRSTTAR